MIEKTNDNIEQQSRLNFKIFYLFFTILLSLPIGSHTQYYQNLPSIFQTEWVISKKALKKKTFDYYNYWKQNKNSLFSNHNPNFIVAVKNIETEIIIKNQKEIYKNIKDIIKIRKTKFCSNYKEEYEINV